tara:strand:- start:1041 stop:1355 length:315 start_codon:yes stop_codon:yes gene_type:complete
VNEDEIQDLRIDALVEQADTLDMDTAQYIVFAEAGAVSLQNDEGEEGTFATLAITSAPLYDILDEDKWTTQTYVFATSYALEEIAGQLSLALEFVTDPTAQENN